MRMFSLRTNIISNFSKIEKKILRDNIYFTQIILENWFRMHVGKNDIRDSNKDHLLKFSFIIKTIKKIKKFLFIKTNYMGNEIPTKLKSKSFASILLTI